MNNQTNKQLLNLLLNSKTKEQGFRLLMQQYQQPLYWHIRRTVISHSDAEDILQETFINVFKYISTFKELSSLKTWLYKIATNECINFFRKKKIEFNTLDETNEALQQQFQQQEFTQPEAIEVKLQQAILTLPEKQRLVFNLRYYDDLSYEEIAEITNTSVGTLKTNYHYASEKIKQLITNNTL